MKVFCKKYNLDKFANIAVGYDYNYFFAQEFKVKGFPYTAIYNKDKRLIHAYLGKMQAKEIQNAYNYQ
jgi:uncharacterized SAM-dependent methyltransferase